MPEILYLNNVEKSQVVTLLKEIKGFINTLHSPAEWKGLDNRLRDILIQYGEEIDSMNE